jgi:branched-subunit amino acid aminotransferase/4-amino-4-deoxychorismate lyase
VSKIGPGGATFVWRDGHLAPAEAAEQLLVADSWLVVDGKTRGYAEHSARFAASCEAEARVSRAEVQAFLDACAERVPGAGRWFPRVECGPGSRLCLRVRPAPSPGTSVVMRPHPGPDPRRKPRVKGPDLAALVAVRRAAEQAGAGEAVLRTEDGIVTEGALSALLWWRDDTLCLPDPDLPILESVTRRLVSGLAAASGTPVRVERARLAELDGLETWSLSALHGIRPVSGWLDCDIRAGRPTRAPDWQRRLEALAR